MESKASNRWVILTASMLCNICIGTGFCWSLYQTQLVKMFNWAQGQVSLTFSFVIIMLPIGMSIAGKLQEKTGPRKMMIIGGLMAGLGVFFASFCTSLTCLYLFYGIISGFGIGVVNSVAITNTIKWFPDKKGLATGLITAALGLGSVVFAPIASSLLKQYGVLSTFKIIGIMFVTIIIFGALFQKAPPARYKPAGYVPETSVVGVSLVEKDWKEMLSDPIFYVLWVMFTMGLVAGLMVISQAAPIVQQVIKSSTDMAPPAIMALSMGNTMGRAVWGYISDKIGRYWALMGIYLISAGSMFYLTNFGTAFSFMLTFILIGLCYGGLNGVFPSVTADMFGLKNMGTNFGIMISAASVASVIGPQLAVKVKESSGGVYDQAFIIAAAMGLLGVILTIIVMLQIKRRTGASSSFHKA